MSRAAYMRERRRERMQVARELLGSKCNRCGSTELFKLQFHHPEKENKLFNVSGAASYELHSFLKEVLKCELLCASCHAKETMKDRPITHGLYATYAAGGCRCDLCREAKRVYQKKLKNRKLFNELAAYIP